MSLLMALLVLHLGWEGLKMIRERCWKDLIVLVFLTILAIGVGILYILGISLDLYKILKI